MINVSFVLIPILRAGLSMLHSTKEVFGDYTTVSFIDYERDEKTLYLKLTQKRAKEKIVLDYRQEIVKETSTATTEGE